MQIFAAVICIYAADTDQCSTVLSPVANGFSHVFSHGNMYFLFFFFCTPYWPLPPFYWVFCWLTARIPEILCWHVIALGQKQATQELAFLLPHIYSFFSSSSSSLLSTIFLPPYKISRHALNYWLVLSPVRLSLVVYCCPSAAVAQGFFFVESPNWERKHGQIYHIQSLR